ncbi:MAG TPA: hypothetical protein VK905_00325 [Bacillota bacterium]|nr:hypothetical protein [Bacillota bacterium]
MRNPAHIPVPVGSPELNVTTIMLEHYAKYPLMSIQDMVKLLYQNEFGSGHFVRSESDSLARLTEECKSLPDAEDDELFEDIGNGLCRLNLAGISNRLSLLTLNRLFVVTANSETGSTSGFEEKLNVLRQLCLTRALPFPLPELEEYLTRYKEQGYPAVSHSEAYRTSYQPAYRLVRRVFRDYVALFAHLDSMLQGSRTINVAIDGNCAAGKSTLATLLSEVYDSNVFHMDDFFLPESRKTETRLGEAGGNVDYERFRDEVLSGIATGEEFSYQPFCCMNQELLDALAVSPKQLNIVEGAYSLHPTLADSYALKVFLSISPELQRQRILERNGPQMQKRFIGEWIPLENSYFAELDVASQCHLAFAAGSDPYEKHS